VKIKLARQILTDEAKQAIDESTLYIDDPIKFDVLNGDFYSSEEHDVSVLKLTPTQKETLKKYQPWVLITSPIRTRPPIQGMPNLSVFLRPRTGSSTGRTRLPTKCMQSEALKLRLQARNRLFPSIENATRFRNAKARHLVQSAWHERGRDLWNSDEPLDYHGNSATETDRDFESLVGIIQRDIWSQISPLR
jgi:hypothetical protein